jgi:hypothetical protein
MAGLIAISIEKYATTPEVGVVDSSGKKRIGSCGIASVSLRLKKTGLSITTQKTLDKN